MFRAFFGMWISDEQILGNDYGVGLESLTNTFWHQEVATPGGVTSVKKMQDKERLRPGVVAIRSTAGRKGVEVEDANGHCETFAATILTCTTRAVQLGINIEDALLSTDVWGALRTLCENVLGELYGPAFSKQKLSDFRVISWQQESGYNGAFRLDYAGQYQDHNALFNQARGSVKGGSKDGLFLAGEGASWEGGWIEGGMQRRATPPGKLLPQLRM